jgi:predicted MFS family arabinose efflux permease
MSAEPLAAAEPHAPAAPAARTGRWGQLALLSGLISMDNSEGSVASVLFPALRTALGVPLSALGVLVAASKLAGMVTGPLWVALAQRTNRKAVLVISSGLWGGWSVAAGLAQNWTQLVLLFTIAVLADLFDDSTRGRASGYLYGGAAVALALIGPLLGQLSRVHDGWRYGFFASGAVTLLFGVLVLLFFQDPGVGAADGRRTSSPALPRTLSRAAVHELFGIRTLRLFLIQRATTSQLTMQSIGVVYLVDVFHYSNATAALVTAPYALAYLLGTVLGGIVADRAQRRRPGAGRLLTWQAATLAWAVVALLGTQITWPSIWIYAACFSALGLLQGFNPGANRPILMAVTRPDLRSAAFALMLSAESVGWALNTLAVGYLSDVIGLRAAVLWLVVVVCLANGLFLSTLYRPYARESGALRQALAQAHP